MKVIALVGSARRKGNTAKLIARSLNPFKENDADCETIFLNDLNIKPCTGCEGCAASNLCVIEDGMTEVYTKLREADVIIAGSPTYFYNMSGLMKMFIDRCYCFTSYDSSDRSAWCSELETGKPRLAGLVSICEQNNESDLGFTADAMSAAFSSLGYRIVFSQKVLHAFKPGEALKEENVLEELDASSLRLFKTAQLLQ